MEEKMEKMEKMEMSDTRSENPRTETDEKIVAAIRAHMQWRVRLQDAIRHKEPLNMEEVSNDRRCELGQWIEQLRPELGNSWEWLHLDEVHQLFHRQAAEVVSLITDDKLDAATTSVREGDYAAASARILDALLRLRDVLGGAR